MEDTYANFINSAANSVSSSYAKQLLADIQEKNSVSDGLLSLADRDFSALLQIPAWVKSAVVLLCLLFFLNLFKEIFKGATIYAAIQQMLFMMIAVTVLIPIYETLQKAQVYMNDLSLFLGVLTPTIGVLAASGGNVSYANTGGTLLSVFLSASQVLISRIIPLVTTLFFGFAMMDVFMGEKKMQTLSKFVRNTCFGAFSIFAAIFFIIIGCQSITASNADTISARTLRLLISNAVPIVGGTIGDALKLVGGGLVTVKNAVGTTAVLFLIGLYLPVLLTIWGNGLILNLLGIASEYLGFKEMEDLLAHAKYAMDFSIAGFTFIFAVGIVNIGIFMSILPVVIA